MHRGLICMKRERNTVFPYGKHLIDRARKLRKESTPGEKALWPYIRKSGITSYRFRRQRPILNFIVDFYCPELKLAIEIDGSSHNGKESYDKWREIQLEELGVTIMRFTEDEARENPEGIALAIEIWIQEHMSKNER